MQYLQKTLKYLGEKIIFRNTVGKTKWNSNRY